TMVRTFAKSELIRAMSFVAVPALIGPMLGPVAGGLIVGFLNWRMIFFINVPIGLVGLYFIYRHLPDYREERVDPAGCGWSDFVWCRCGPVVLCSGSIR